MQWLVTTMTILCGCSTNHVVERAAAPSWGPEAVHRYAGEEIEVVLRDGSRHGGEILNVDSRQVVQRSPSLGLSTSIPLDSVLVLDGGSNAGWVIAGVLGGVIVGGSIGYALAWEEAGIPGDPTGFSNAIGASGGGLIGALIGGALGGMVVGLASKTHDYTIVESHQLPQKPGTTTKQQVGAHVDTR